MLRDRNRKSMTRRNGVKIATIISATIVFVVAPVFLNTQPTYDLRPEQQHQKILSTLYKTDEQFQISRVYNLLYVHIPKTGGSTLENSVLFDEARAHHMVGGHHPISKMLHHKHRRGLDHMLKISSVRHPCERFISAFYYLKNGGVNVGDAKRAKDYGIDKLGIDEFVKLIDNRAWFNRAPVHFIPQVDYLFYKTDGVFGGRAYARDKPSGTFGLDMVLCQEQWEEGLNRLSYKMRSRNLPDDLHVVTNHLTEDKLTCRDLSVETREMIERVYAMDYCVLGYNSLLSDEDVCVGSFMTPEQFTAKYRECQQKINIDLALRPWL